ncbi:MAG: helix-turn-helix domain-containing protein [Tistlia sp.]|uniref:helix-turn-helix domain-containing protein n=1 Tax=Tistlia sp. TaxID=3057121 RepID=UPI0034A5C6ED
MSGLQILVADEAPEWVVDLLRVAEAIAALGPASAGFDTVHGCRLDGRHVQPVALIEAAERRTEERSARSATPLRLVPTIKRPEGRRSVEQIFEVVVTESGVSKADLKSGWRKASVAQPRQVLMYLLASLTSLSMAGVGRLVGHRDSTTVWHAHRVVAKDVLTGGFRADLAQRCMARLRDLPAPEPAPATAGEPRRRAPPREAPASPVSFRGRDDEQPRPLVTEHELAALYGGQRYEDVRRRS